MKEENRVEGLQDQMKKKAKERQGKERKRTGKDRGKEEIGSDEVRKSAKQPSPLPA